jgi:hypothetical protein
MPPLDDKDLTGQLQSGITDCQAGVPVLAAAGVATVPATSGSGPARTARRSRRRP